MITGFLFSTPMEERASLESRIRELFAGFGLEAITEDCSLPYRDIITVKMGLSGNQEDNESSLSRVNDLLYPETRLVPITW